MEASRPSSRQETYEGGGSDDANQEVSSAAESEGVDDDVLEELAANLIGFGYEDDSDEDDAYDDDDELQREAETQPRVQRGNKYMKGTLFKKTLDGLIKDKHMDRNDPVVKLLYDHGFNELPEWDLSTAHSLRGEVARAVAGCCESEDVDIDKLNPYERVLAECVMHHLEIQKSIGGTISSSVLPILEELTARQWGRELYKYISPEWRQFFQPDQEELPDVTGYLSSAPLPGVRGIYVGMLIGKALQHDHLYVGSGLGRGGVLQRQHARRRQYDGTQEPHTFFEKLMCEKDPTTEERVRDFPVWGNPLAFPDEAFNSYTRGLFLVVLGLLAEAVFGLRLGGYHGLVKRGHVQELHRLRLNCPWWGTMQHCPLLDKVPIPWPEGMKQAIRKAYDQQYHVMNRDKIIARMRAKYAKNAFTFPCEADPGCDRMFSVAKAAQTHARICPGRLEYECPLGCGASLSTERGISRHTLYYCRLSDMRRSVPCPRGCGSVLARPDSAREHANSAACIYFNGKDLVGVLCVRGCGKTFQDNLSAARHAMTTACTEFDLGSTVELHGDEVVLVPVVAQAAVPRLPDVSRDDALRCITSLLGCLDEDEDMFRRYVDSAGQAGMDELVKRYNAERDGN